MNIHLYRFSEKFQGSFCFAHMKETPPGVSFQRQYVLLIRVRFSLFE